MMRYPFNLHIELSDLDQEDGGACISLVADIGPTGRTGETLFSWFIDPNDHPTYEANPQLLFRAVVGKLMMMSHTPRSRATVEMIRLQEGLKARGFDIPGDRLTGFALDLIDTQAKQLQDKRLGRSLPVSMQPWS